MKTLCPECGAPYKQDTVCSECGYPLPQCEDCGDRGPEVVDGLCPDCLADEVLGDEEEP